MPLNHQQKLDAIRLACIAVNPSIKSKNHMSIGNNLRCKNCGEPDSYENQGTCTKGEERPIQLSDILLVFNSRCILIGIEADGSFITYEHMDVWKSYYVKWNLLLPLHLQEPETISFIYELIK